MLLRSKAFTKSVQFGRAYSKVAESSNAAPKVFAGLVLQRDPIVTPERSTFEIEYHKYNEWIKYKSAIPFPREFYLKKQSIAERNYLVLERERQEINYFDQDAPSTKKSGGKAGKQSTEEQEQEQLQDQDDQVLAMNEKGEGSSKGESVELFSRITEADKTGDIESLERKIDRTLYLLVKDQRFNNEWRLPANELQNGEVLFKSILRTIPEFCGENIDVWVVGRGPIGHLIEKPPKSTQASKVFFLKAHILAGKIVGTSASLEHAWVSKEEIEQMATTEYYNSIKDMLARI